MEPVAAKKQEGLVNEVRKKYGEIAKTGSSCCGTGSADTISISVGYDADALGAIPEEANLGLGCGAPIDHLALKHGETALDLGSGAGIDAFLAAERVGASGHVIGVDMTPEMLDRARDNAAKAGVDNVDFREGRLESLPVEDASVDAVPSNQSEHY